MNIYYLAAIWLGLALAAPVVSIGIAVPAAPVEIAIGALAGDIPGIREHVTTGSALTGGPSPPGAAPALTVGCLGLA